MPYRYEDGSSTNDPEPNYSKWRDPYWYMAMTIVFTLASLIVYAVI